MGRSKKRETEQIEREGCSEVRDDIYIYSEILEKFDRSTGNECETRNGERQTLK